MAEVCRCTTCGGGDIYPGLPEAREAAKKRSGRRFDTMSIFCRFCGHGHIEVRRKSLKEILFGS